MMIEDKKQKPSPNENQQKASNPDYSVWVEASAGTGKTKVLRDRVLRLLLKGVKPSKILCLTYTKAAAWEMKDRISKMLSRWAIVSQKELVSDLKDICGTEIQDEEKQIEQCSKARKLFATFLDSSEDIKIQTIHSFCQDILKRFPLEAKISPYFEVMDDRKSKEILDRIKVDILTDSSDEDTYKAVGYLVGKVSEYSFPKLLLKITENRTKIAEFLRRYVFFTDVKTKLALTLGVDSERTENKLKEEFLQNIDESFISRVTEIFSKSKTKTDIEHFQFFKKLKNYGISDDDLDKYISVFLKDSGEIRKKGLYCADSFAYNSDIEHLMNDEALRVRDFMQNMKNAELYFSTISVLQIAHTLISKYDEYKRKVSQMDYEDLILLTKKLLADKTVADWVMYKLDEGIEHILVDEAQDNSMYQWDIIKSLSEEFFAGEGSKQERRTIFAVGDRKQSIYSFQGADPQKFEAMKSYFSNKTLLKTINLDVSFRSASAVLSVVNTVFKFERAKKGVVPDEKNVDHLAYNSSWGGKVEFWDICDNEESGKNNQFEPEDFDYSKQTKEGLFAKKIVQKIKEIVKNKTYLCSKKRLAEYKDFMLLVRNRTGRFLPEFLHECQKEGVPTEGSDQINLLEQISIQDLISLGKFLLLPTDDLSLAEVLKSPVFGLEEDDLIKLCVNRGSSSLWSRLSDFSEYKNIYDDLCCLLDKVDFVRPYELYSYVLGPMGGRKNFIERMGLEVEDGLDEFINLAISFEEDHIPSLQGFINWIMSDEIKIKRELEQSKNNAVKIMTVHGSKGLQSPIVILPDAGSVTLKKHSMEILQDNLIYVPLSSKNYEERCENIYQKEQEKELEEYRRLLYVAITRAADQVFICGYRKNDKTYEDSWHFLCREAVGAIGDKVAEGFEYSENKQALAYEVLDNEEENKKNNHLPNFNWLHENAPAESALEKPYRPSIDGSQQDELSLSPVAENDEYRYKRGLIIHKILQFIDFIPLNFREQKIKEFLKKNATGFSERVLDNIASEILNLLNNPNFSFVFTKNAKTEVSVMGEVDGKIISAQIDRLIINEKNVVVVDYKTNRPAAENMQEVPLVYQKQLKTYCELLRKIYPQKTIEAYILWTNTARLMKII